MLEITCPFCGPRNESEFVNGGPAKKRRADKPDDVADTDWIDYLIVAPNPMGPVTEEWWHMLGCERWFTIERDTVTHEILGGPKPSHG